MTSYVSVPYSQEFPSECEDWREVLVARAHEVAGRSDHFSERQMVQVAGSPGWFNEGDPEIRYRPVITRALVLFFAE